jgi:hypothetical protein
MDLKMLSAVFSFPDNVFSPLITMKIIRMGTYIIMLGLATTSNAFSQVSDTIHVCNDTCALDKVLMFIDIIHFRDCETECDYNICVCKEARAGCSESMHDSEPYIKGRTAVCFGDIKENKIAIRLPAELTNTNQADSFCIEGDVNVINHEREIVYRIVAGNYPITQCGNKTIIIADIEKQQ